MHIIFLFMMSLCTAFAIPFQKEGGKGTKGVIFVSGIPLTVTGISLDRFSLVIHIKSVKTYPGHNTYHVQRHNVV